MEHRKKHMRLDIIDLKKNHPEKFGRFLIALKNLQESDDWYRICGIHGNTFKPNDEGVLCPTDPKVVSVISDTGEPFYCKHSVYPFIAWHVPYVYQFELLLNKYADFDDSDKEYITLPYMDLTNFSNDFTFINEPTICIRINGVEKTIDNPLAFSYYYVDGVKTKTTRNGYLTPVTHRQRIQLKTVKKQLNNTLYAKNYETFSSHPVAYSKNNIVVDYIPLETPHNTLHDVIGGDGGNMSDITISAFDPIFWLHHCNMDRHFYTWLHENTDNFKKSLYPHKISKENYESSQAPFFKDDIYDNKCKNYKYGWTNSCKSVMLLKDTLDLDKFPYKYDLVKKTPEVPISAFVELIDIPIPRESVTYVAYLYKSDEPLNKTLHFAGSASWFGINRNEKACGRCDVTRTNLKIDIEEYILQNNITNANKGEYTLVIEGEGRLQKGLLGYSLYGQNDLIQDGTFQLVIA